MESSNCVLNFAIGSNVPVGGVSISLNIGMISTVTRTETVTRKNVRLLKETPVDPDSMDGVYVFGYKVKKIGEIGRRYATDCLSEVFQNVSQQRPMLKRCYASDNVDFADKYDGTFWAADDYQMKTAGSKIGRSLSASYLDEADENPVKYLKAEDLIGHFNNGLFI